MQKIKNKQPIHLQSDKRGKLRKVIRQIHPLFSDDVSDLIVATQSQSLQHQHGQHRQKQYFLLRKHTHQKRNWQSSVSDQKEKQETGGSGAFRAIHTACPYDPIKGFPLRSGTPVRPFRRGIRALSINQKVLQLSSLQQERPVTRVPRPSMSTTYSNPASFRGMIACEHNPSPRKLAEVENQEEFFMYKEPKVEVREMVKDDQEESVKVVAGTTIEPFKKYQIRQIQRGIYTRQTAKNRSILV